MTTPDHEMPDRPTPGRETIEPAPTDVAPDRGTAEGARPSQPLPSRLGVMWLAVIMFAVVLLLLLIFILQNSQRVEVSFFGAHGHPPMGVALLLAAVFGILLVAIPGSARIVQLRLRDRRRRGSGSRRAAARRAKRTST